ncbi:MAG: hypothetical protein NTZ93_01150 [Candidatus Beckwithbacteria bacterium]|nr:hypothetical protein [Candidatus Beckwithbacteria bacterium]
MKKIILFIIIALIFPALVQAATATDSSLTDKIKERLEKTAEEGVDKIKEDLVTKSQAPRPKAYVGQINSIADDSIVVTYKAQNYPLYLAKKENYQINDYILALGFFYPDKNHFEAKKIVRLTPPQPPINRQLIDGQIEEIDGNKITVDGKKLTLTTKTDLTVKNIANPSVNNLELKDTLFAIVVFDKSGNLSEVKNVLVIPGKNNPASTIPTNATESASASPSAKIQ